MLGVERIGRYEVLGHLASGGMGQVYLAKTTGLGGFERHVVVKTLDVADDEDQFVTMFLDEARLVGALHHQYIAPVYEVGCDEDGRYFLVMDYIHGETAEAVWKRSHDGDAPAIPIPFALSVVYAVASALDYAHKLCGRDGRPLEIVHRDVSLSNVMIGYDGGGEADRLRHREVGEPRDQDHGRHGQGQVRLHVARAGAAAAGRSPHRHLRARRSCSTS